jgi:iduronate 2-sulfatase
MDAAGQQTDALIETVDIYPTLTELTGLPAPPQHQGISFAPLFDDPGRPWKEAVFGQYRRGGPDGVLGRTVRTDRYRYVEWTDLASEEVRARELYDHQTDPYENINMVERKIHESLVDSLTAVLREGWQAALPSAPNESL